MSLHRRRAGWLWRRRWLGWGWWGWWWWWGGGPAWPLATDTSSHTAGGASCGSPKVFVCVCGTEIDRREIANEHPPPLPPPVSSHIKLQAIINHLAGFIVWFTAHARQPVRARCGGEGSV